jgi:hypothetical protein
LSEKEEQTMGRIAAKLVIGMAITAIGMFGADSSIGTWKYNVAKSKTISTNPLKSRTEVWEATPDGGVKVTRTGQRADGTAETGGFTAKYDGKEYPVTAGPTDAIFISIKRVNANTISLDIKSKSGPLHQTVRSVISKDGKTKTDTVKGTGSDGKPVAATNVYEKQ